MQPHADTTQPHGDNTRDITERFTVSEAAELLGITAEAVRQRIRRGTLRSEKDDAGSVFVLLTPRKHQSNRQPHADATQPYDDHTTDNTILYERMAQEIDYLRSQLDRAEERDRENRRIIAALTQRIPELPPPDTASEPRETPMVASEGEGGGETPPDTERRSSERSWWQRWFGL